MSTNFHKIELIRHSFYMQFDSHISHFFTSTLAYRFLRIISNDHIGCPGTPDSSRESSCTTAYLPSHAWPHLCTTPRPLFPWRKANLSAVCTGTSQGFGATKACITKNPPRNQRTGPTKVSTITILPCTASCLLLSFNLYQSCPICCQWVSSSSFTADKRKAKLENRFIQMKKNNRK